MVVVYSQSGVCSMVPVSCPANFLALSLPGICILFCLVPANFPTCPIFASVQHLGR